MMKHTPLTIAFLLGLLLTTQAQTPTAPPDRQRAETGLPFITWFGPQEYNGTNQIWSFAQDDRGLLYVGTANGILEYDGVSWRPIATPRNAVVRALAKGPGGRIFVSGTGDFGYLQPEQKTGEMKFVSLLDYVPKEERDFQEIWRIHVAPEGVYFQAREKLFRLTPEGQGWQVKVWKPKTSFTYSFYVFGTVYLSTSGVGLQRLTGDAIETLPWPGLGDQTGNSIITVMLPYAEAGTGSPRQILIGNRSGQLSLMDDNGIRPFPTEAAPLLKSHQPSRGVILGDGALGLGTSTGGYLILERNGRLRRYLDRAAGIQSDGVVNAFTDRSGTLWLGLQNGLAKIEVMSPLTEFGRGVGITASVQDIVRYRGDLYAAATTGGVRRLDTATGMFQPVPGYAYPQTFNLLTHGDHLLAAASRDGVIQITGNTVRPIPLNKTTNTSVFSLAWAQQDANRVWLGTNDGLAAMRWDTAGRWVDEGWVAKTPQVRTIVEPEPGLMWLGTQSQGVVRVRLQGDSLLNPKVERFGKANGLPDDGGVSVHYAAGRVIFVSNSGVAREFDEASGRFVESRLFGAIPADRRGSNRIVTDAQGNIWATFGALPVLLRRQSDGTYQTDDSLLRRIGNSRVNHLYADADGVLWVGSNERIFRFDPAQARSSGAEGFPTLVRRVTAGEQGNNLLYGGGGGAAAQLQTSLAYRDNSLRVEFAAASLEDPTRNQFQTRLEGFDHDWSAWTRETRRDYTNLPPGSYRFRVKALNALGQTGTEAEYRLTILPPWYRTWWAYGVYTLMLVAAIYGVDRIQRRRVVAREREKSALREAQLRADAAAEKAKSLQAENEAYQRLKATQEQLLVQEKLASLGALTAGIAHEIKNPLNFVNNFADLSVELMEELREDIEKHKAAIPAKDYENIEALLDDLSSNAKKINEHGKRADGIVRSMLLHSRGQAGERQPTDINAMLEEYVNLTYHGMRAQDSSFNITIERALASDAGTVEAIPQDLSRVFLNLLNNACYAVNDRAKKNGAGFVPILRVSSVNLGDAVEVRIRDNGMGIPPDVREKIFNPFFTTKPTGQGTGLGLSISHDIVVQQHGGQLEVETEPGEFTEFILRLPRVSVARP